MGFFSKLFHRKDDFDLDEPLPGEGKPPGSPDPLASPGQPPQDDLGLEEKPIIPETPASPDLPPHLEEPSTPPSQPTPATPTAPAGTPQRDLELINSKLDTIKALINSLDQRTANLEKAAGLAQQKKMPW